MILEKFERYATYFLVDGKKVVTLSALPEAKVPCEGCENFEDGLQCCTGAITPVLTDEELVSRKYGDNASLMPLPHDMKSEFPNADFIAVLAMPNKTKCPYLEGAKCKIYNDRPASCKSYDCRTDNRTAAQNVCRQRFNEDGSLRIL